MSSGPTDWVSGERVFAPPSGTVDADWLVPALLEAVPGTDAATARQALAAAWLARREGRSVSADDDVAQAADVVLAEAAHLFEGGRGGTSAG